MNVKLQISIIGILVIIVLFIIGLSFVFHQGNAPTSTSVLPSPTIAQPVIYDKAKANQVLHALVNRQALNTNDSQVKQKLIGQVHGDILYNTADFIIEYIQPLDQFQVEVNSINVDQAKREAESWFVNQGLDQIGICTLPVSFVVSGNVMQQLQAENKNISFNPLPDGC